MIVITGTQRSGTSFMARLFKESGYDLGTEFWDDRIDGGLENPHICNFFRDLVGDNYFPFSKYWDMEDSGKQYKSFHNLSGIAKFSYLLSIPRFVDQWFDSRGSKSDTFIIMTRDAKKVVQSKESRPEFYDEDYHELNQSADEVRANRQESLLKMNKYKMKYILVPFPIKNGQYLINTLNTTLGSSLKHEVFNKIFDETKIHF